MTVATDRFYSAPNEVDPARVVGDRAHLLDTLRSRLDISGWRTLLPAKIGTVSRWYAVAPTQRDGRLFREELQCWFAPPLTAGYRTVSMGSPDLIDKSAWELVPGGAVFRLDVRPEWAGQVRQNVLSLIDVWSLAPDRSIDQPRPVGRILRQFYEGLVGNDRSQAEAALDELKGRALLSATNLRFLRVELLNSVGSLQELVDETSLDGISLLTRPPAVTEILAAAADSLLLASLPEKLDDYEMRGAAIKLDVIWPALVTHTHQVTSLSTARCYALGQLLIEDPKYGNLRQVLAKYPDDALVSGVLATTSFEQVETHQSSSPAGLYYQGDYEGALRSISLSRSDRSAASIALAAAVNLQDSSSAVTALAVVQSLTESERDGLLSSAVERHFYAQLLALTANERVPSDWVDWMTGDWPDRPELLSEWSRSWPRTSVEIGAIADELADVLIDALNDARRPRIRNGLPLLVEWLTSDGVPPVGVAFATTVFDIMLSSEPGRAERSAALALMECVLVVGCSADEYGEMLVALTRELMVIGPRDGMWLAQGIDLLLAYACPKMADRNSFIARASAVVQSWGDLVDRNDALLLHLLFRAAGIEIYQIDPATPVGSKNRAFTSVGVYSLKENAIRVLTSWIEDRWPGVKVRASTSDVNSKPLAALVRGVDVMLVQTSHATHAATAAITAASVDPSRIVLVSGRGATSMLRSLLDWVEGS